ncbi:MAG: MFS transporter, partial [Pseudomonadales bacterium]|nr:MFS transporter [Pseudomonadales bacterium]
GASDDMGTRKVEPPAFGEVVRHMWKTPSLRHIVLGGALASFVGYGLVLWLPAYFVRSHGLSQTEVGFTLAFLYGIVGGLGTFTAGMLADKLSDRDPRWLLWVIALGLTLAVPTALLSFSITDTKLAIAIYCIPAFFGGFYLGPGFSAIQALVPVNMRSVGAAINLFMTNLIGLGIGPQMVGVLSDFFHADFGNESLRYALMVFILTNLWAAFHYSRATRTLAHDLKEAKS